jgi:four helix bundle protein
MEDEVLERNKNLNRGFRKLEVWREAVDLSAFEKKFLDSVKHISFKIKDQVLDSVFSISSNVAEGYCRKSIKEYIQFVNVALGSCGENYSQIYDNWGTSICK